MLPNSWKKIYSNTTSVDLPINIDDMMFLLITTMPIALIVEFNWTYSNNQVMEWIKKKP